MKDQLAFYRLIVSSFHQLLWITKLDRVIESGADYQSRSAYHQERRQDGVPSEDSPGDSLEKAVIRMITLAVVPDSLNELGATLNATVGEELDSQCACCIQ
jgi:hypothetical protein